MNLSEAEYKRLLKQRNGTATAKQPKAARKNAMRAEMSAGRILRLEILVPIQVVSEMNQHEHWTVRHRRNKEQQSTFAAYWQVFARGLRIEPPCVIRLTRIGQNRMDDGNLGAAFKHVQDAIAASIGIDDGDERLRWEYHQITGSEERAVKVEFICEGGGAI